MLYSLNRQLRQHISSQQHNLRPSHRNTDLSSLVQKGFLPAAETFLMLTPGKTAQTFLIATAVMWYQIYTTRCVILQLSEQTNRPGRYEHETQRNRRVEYHQNFGGQPINIPTVSHKSTISRNTDKVTYK